MNNKAFSISNGNLVIRADLYDVLIVLLVITTLAFYDIKFIFLGLQLLTFAYAFVITLRRGFKKHTTTYVFWLALFSIYGLISLLWASHQNTTALSVNLSVIQVGLIGYCIIDYCVDITHLRRVIWAFLAACVMLCIRFIISVPVSLWGQGDRFSKDTIFGSNTPALVLAYGAILALWLIFEKEHTGLKRIVLFCEVTCFMFVSMLAGTRKGIIAFLVAFIVILLMRAKNPIEIFGKLILIALIIAGAYVAVMKIPILYGAVGYRIESMLSGFMGGEADKSAIGRSVMLRDAWEVFLKHPVIGVGQDGYRYINKYFFTYSHNNYVELLSNLGIIGFFCFYSLYIWIFNKCRKMKKSGILPMCILVILIVMDWGAVGYATESTYVLLGIALSSIYCLREESK